MKRLYLVLLFLLGFALSYVYVQREHLTNIEVDQKVDPLEKRIDTLEDEYRAISTHLKKQDEQAKAATAQATNLQAALHSQIHQ